MDFFPYEAWLHADVPRVACTACGKTTMVTIPWANEGSGSTLLFEALALSLCKELPVAQAAKQLRVQSGKEISSRRDIQAKVQSDKNFRIDTTGVGGLT